MAEPLLVVDVQRGFINAFTQHVPGRIKRLIDTGEFSPVLFSVFVNTPGSPYQRLLDWHACAAPPETDLVDELAPLAAHDRIFQKRGLTGLPVALADRLRRDYRDRRHYLAAPEGDPTPTPTPP